MANPLKPLKFVGSAQDDIRAMPAGARHALGVELTLVQLGRMPNDFKPMPTVGTGACGIRVRDASGAYRAIYVARFAEAIYVLHAFHKKTRRTAKIDPELAARRYKLIGG